MNTDPDSSLQAIPRKMFLLVYLIVPVLITIVIIDSLYFEAALRPYLGLQAVLIPLYIFVFDLPHVIASFFSFFDKEYVSYYKKHLCLYLPGFLAATALLFLVNFELGIVFYLLNDLWHSLRQKVGIALILGARPGLLHTAWTIVPFVFMGFGYISTLRPDTFSSDFTASMIAIGPVAVGILFVLMLLKIHDSAPKARLYIFAVSMLFISSYFFIILGYVFFAILAFRFVHDLTAFMFYITHDRNRNQVHTKNWLYKIVNAISVPYFIMVPVLAIIAAYAVRILPHQALQTGLSIAIVLGMSHYYLESVMWKRDTPHRQNVRVSK